MKDLPGVRYHVVRGALILLVLKVEHKEDQNTGLNDLRNNKFSRNSHEKKKSETAYYITRS